MTLHLMFDASSPPSSPYPGSHAVAGYIGGMTPHEWDAAEWQPFSQLAQFPIWVDDPAVSAAVQGETAARRALAFGWTALGVPRRAVVYDIETERAPARVDDFANSVWAAGYETVVYGSESTLLASKPKEGRWIALYNGQANIPPDPGAIGHQYRADVPWDNTRVDLSVITDEMMRHAGYGPRHHH